jgi:protease-4
MPDRRTNVVLWVILGGGAFLFFTLTLLAFAFYVSSERNTASLGFGFNQVAVLDLEGVIYDSKEFTEQLKTFGTSSSVKAVVLRVNSPGGGVAPSQEIYEAIKKFRAESKKRVVVSMASVAASGGYYIACGADRIFANPGSITGSIGVIAEWYNYGGLLRWAKMEPVVIKSGEMKDAGSPTRPLTEAEKAYFQSLIDSMYGQFVTAVVSGRKMDEAVVRKLADGRVFTGQEALRNGLIDEIGTLQDAVAAAAKMAQISGEPRIVSPVKKRTTLWDLLFGDARAALSINPDRSESNIRFQYLWR